MKKSYKEAILYDKLDGNKCRCYIFKTRYNDEGKLYSVIYGRVASQAISPIEKKPMYHFYPGFLWLSVGSVGCDFYCPGCQNFDLTFVDVMNEKKHFYDLYKLQILYETISHPAVYTCEEADNYHNIVYFITY